MSVDSPTLKIRVDLSGNRASHWGRDCHSMAKEIVGDAGTVLDAKWGREPQKWHDTDRGWGRVRIPAKSAGFVDAVRLLAPDGSVEARLVQIIDEMTR